MASLTYAQVLTYLQNAGFKGNSAYIMAAIAQAESGLNPASTNCNNVGGTCDRGLYQINNYWHSEVSDACAYDPVCSSQQVYRISEGGTNFNPWVTYTSGAYRQYLNPTIAASTTPSKGPSMPASSTGNPMVKSWIANLGEHIGVFILAILLIVIGLLLLAEKQMKAGLQRASDVVLGIGL